MTNIYIILYVFICLSVPIAVIIHLLHQYVRYNVTINSNQFYVEFLTQYFGITYFKAKRYVSFRRRNRAKKVETFHTQEV